MCALLNARVSQRLSKEQIIAAAFGDNAPNIQSAASMVADGEKFGCAAHTAQLVLGAVANAHFGQLLARARVRTLNTFT